MRPETTRFERWSTLCGPAFALSVLFALVVSPARKGPGDTPAEVLEYAIATERWIRVSQFVAALGLVLVPLFATGLFVRLRRRGAEAEALLTVVAGAGFALLYFLTITAWDAPLLSLAGDEDAPRSARLADAQTYLGASDVGWVLFAGVGVAAALMIVAASTGAARAAIVPAWAGRIGVALGAAALATVVVVGMYAWLAWLLLAPLALIAADRR